MLHALATEKYIAALMQRTNLTIVELVASALHCYDVLRTEVDDKESKVIFRRPDGEEIEFDPLGN